MYVLMPQTVVNAPVPTRSVARPKAFAQCSAPLKSSSGFTAPEEDGNERGRDRDGGSDVAFGLTMGMPAEVDRRVGGGGASASALPRVAALLRRSISIGTLIATVENAS